MPLVRPSWIAADWGTSALRVWAMGDDGSVLARADSQDGMNSLGREDFEPALLRLVGDWLADHGGSPVPVIVCGMAGARQGWKEADYRSVPCRPVAGPDLTRAETEDSRLAVLIVPGLSQAELPDVMRGEETQLAGLVDRLGDGKATVCLPGTHSKWARLDGGEVTGFTSFMTGEMFSLYARQSILRHSVDERGSDQAAFLAAAAEMLAQPDRLGPALFGIRAASLLSDADPASAWSRLSGLLIGWELAAMRDSWRDTPVHLAGSRQMTEAYAAVLEQAGADPIIEDTEALTLRGLAIARAEAAVSVART